ncbi:MAG: hypothetical protein ACRDOJ_01370, partial [Nocardioidaceae bacterium]
MEHRTALALAGAVVAVGGSGAVAVGTFTGAIGPSAEDAQSVVQPTQQRSTAAPRRTEEPEQKRPVERVTRTIEVPMPAPEPPAAPAQVAAPAPPVAAAAP